MHGEMEESTDKFIAHCRIIDKKSIYYEYKPKNPNKLISTLYLCISIDVSYYNTLLCEYPIVI